MLEPKFNLLDEPWIIAADFHGRKETLSLTDILIRSHELRSLSGEMPSQDIAMLRLLLGILYAIYTRTEEYEEARDDGSEDMCVEIWKTLWERRHFPAAEIKAYFDQYRDRFWLLHPERPFYQVPEIKKGSPFAVSKMIGELVESGNKVQLFPIRSGKSKQYVEYAEAARWLLYLNSFDDAAAKPTQKGLETMSVGWLGRLGLVYAMGNNLFETLMLNFSLFNNGKPWGSGNATWELSEPRIGERTPISVPNSGEELYTLQSRRVQLKWDNDKVTGFTLLGGDQFPIEDAFVEPMTTWKLHKGKAGQKDMYIPPSNAGRNPSKQLWRDFAPLLAKSKEARPPGIIEWLGKLANTIPSNQIHICTLLIKYGSMQSGVDDIWSDSLSVNANLLSALGDAWVVRITNLIELTEALVRILGNLASNIAISTGSSDGSGNRIIAQEQVYAALDMPFRNWLAAIEPKENDMDDRCKAWVDTARKIILKHGENLVAQAGTQAFVGRSVTRKNRSDYYSAPKVYGWFKGNISKKLKEEGYGKEESR